MLAVINTTAVRVTFQDTRNQPTIYYKVEYRAETTNTYTEGATITFFEDQTSYSAIQAGLMPGTAYLIRVVPFSFNSGVLRGIPSPTSRIRFDTGGTTRKYYNECTITSTT